MIKELIKLATRLDAKGLIKEADELDSVIRKIAAGLYDPSSTTSAAAFLKAIEQDEALTGASYPGAEGNDAKQVTQWLEKQVAEENWVTPEQRLITMIRASEKLAEKLGLSHFEVGMTAEELRVKLIDVLHLENLSPEDVDRVLSMAANLVESPAKSLSATPRVRIRPDHDASRPLSRFDYLKRTKP